MLSNLSEEGEVHDNGLAYALLKVKRRKRKSNTKTNLTGYAYAA